MPAPVRDLFARMHGNVALQHVTARLRVPTAAFKPLDSSIILGAYCEDVM